MLNGWVVGWADELLIKRWMDRWMDGRVDEERSRSDGWMN